MSFTRKDSDHAYGTAGAFNLITTDPKEGRFKWIQVLSTAVIDSYTDLDEAEGSGSLVGLELEVGSLIAGDFRSIQLASGAVRLYNYSKSPI